MALKPQSTREWLYLIGLAVFIIIVIGWAYLIAPWQVQLEKNKGVVAKRKKSLVVLEKHLKKSVELEIEHKNLINDYSNHLQNIRDVRMPDNLKNVLLTEFYNISQNYDCTAKKTEIREPQTNEMYKLLSYSLTGVDCDWESLNMLLALIEDAGQLVGFDKMRISGIPNRKDPTDVKMKISQMNVNSYSFDKGTKKWTMPAYTNIIDQLKRNIFSLPDGFGPPQRKTMLKPMRPESALPPWSRHITLTSVIDFIKPLAIFYDKSKRKNYSIEVGGIISNTTPAATLKSIDFDKEEVLVSTYVKDYVIPLRTYRDFYIIAEEEVANSSLPTLKSATVGLEELGSPASTNGTDAIALNKKPTKIPAGYKNELGDFSEVSVKFGTFLVTVDAFAKRRNRLSADYGMMVHRVQKLSPAAKAGLKGRDVIMQIDGKKVDDNQTFTYALNEAYKNNKENISLSIKRGSTTKQLTVNME